VLAAWVTEYLHPHGECGPGRPDPQEVEFGGINWSRNVARPVVTTLDQYGPKGGSGRVALEWSGRVDQQVVANLDEHEDVPRISGAAKQRRNDAQRARIMC
jgi:hypothetical protein